MATSLRTPALVTAAQATTFIDVHAIVPDPSFFNGKDPQAIKKAITVMLDGASATYASLGLRFRFSALELTSEPVLAKDRGPGITLSGPPLNFEMPRTARATHYPGRLVVFFRSYVGGPTSVAFNYSSYFADYVVMGNLNGTDRPADEPRNCPSAGPKSPEDKPCRYSNGNTSLIFGVFRHHGGRIAEVNRRRSPVSGSTRRSLTRGTVTSTAPALVSTSRGS